MGLLTKVTLWIPDVPHAVFGIKPYADRVFFAGEAAAENGLFATCGGACLNGESVARKVHATLA
jgi:hypothetical protein